MTERETMTLDELKRTWRKLSPDEKLKLWRLMKKLQQMDAQASEQERAGRV